MPEQAATRRDPDLHSICSSEHQFRLLIQNATDYAFCLLDPLGYVLSWNAGAERMHQFKSDEILGQHFGRFFPTDHAERGAPDECLRKAAAEKKFEEDGWRIRKDASRFWARISLTPLFDEDSHLRGFVHILRDATQGRQAEEDSQRKDQFLAALFHELRNPMASMRNALYVVRKHAQAMPEAAHAVAIMERQLDQMSRLVDDMLDVSRITRGLIELRKARVDLSAILRTVIETVRPQIDAAGHELTVALPPQPLLVHGDAARLAQVFGNLLSNAAKFTENNGRIWLTAERHLGRVRVIVRDNGVGIMPEMLDRVFDLYVQSSHTVGRSQGGLGIGLSIVRQLVIMHGGTVEVQSAGPGCGSEFQVRLPIATDIVA